MNYALISNNTITAHGTASQLWPETSFAASGPNVSFLAAYNAVAIRSDAAYNPNTEFLQSTEPYLLNGEVFNTIAAAIPPAPPPQPDYRGFWDAILISQIYQTVYGIATTSLPMNTALTAFIAAFQDAKEGRPNVGAIQACIFLVMQAGDEVLTADHLAELQGVMDAANLGDIYTLTPPPAP